MHGYDQKAIALILNINKFGNIALVKNQIVELIRELETDDKIYIFNPSGLCFEKKGEAVAALANYQMTLVLEDLIRDALAALEFEDFSCGQVDKHIYFISDNTDFNEYHVNKLLKRCEKNRCQICFFETIKYFKEDALENFDDLSIKLIQTYKGSNEST